jgi:AcrR family transcriptional regulator
MTSTGKTWHRRKDKRTEEILAAAQLEFSANGFDATTMASIAARAGIAKGTIYLYYPNKQALFDALKDGLVPPEVEATDNDMLAS